LIRRLNLFPVSGFPFPAKKRVSLEKMYNKEDTPLEFFWLMFSGIFAQKALISGLYQTIATA
jgi:hypothetical protein